MRTEGIGNKIFLIVMLCAALGLFLYIRPRLFSPAPSPTLLDRLPESDILGKFYVLDLARETHAMMYYHKVPFRDLVSPEFLLSQGKNYGIDLQKPGYFFSNDKGEWGAFLHVIDSSKIQAGILRLQDFTEIKDTVIHKKRVRFLPKQNLYLFWEKSYIFVYHGTHMKRRMGRVMYAQYGEVSPGWKKFESLKMFRNEKLVVFSSSKKLQKLGIDYGLFSHDTDSVSFKLKTYVKSLQPLLLKLKPAPSIALDQQQGMERSLNLHLDITEFRKNKQHPLYKWISELGRKVSFPTDAFFEAWNGDLSFQQGGTQMVKEEIIETQYDEEFNLTEVRTTKLVPVPGFSILVSLNDKGNKLVNSLFAKGIITRQDRKYRFLFSPPLHMTILPDYICAYSADRKPVIGKDASCSGLWNYNGTPVAFRIDSLKEREVFGSLEFPVNRLIRKSKYF